MSAESKVLNGESRPAAAVAPLSTVMLGRSSASVLGGVFFTARSGACHLAAGPARVATYTRV